MSTSVDIDWGDIRQKIMATHTIPDYLPNTGIHRMHLSVWRGQSGDNKRVIEICNSQDGWLGNTEGQIVDLAFQGVVPGEVLEFRRVGREGTCRVTRTAIGDVIIIEWTTLECIDTEPMPYVESLMRATEALIATNS